MTLTVPARPARLGWQQATVVSVVAETYRAKTFKLRPAEWRPFKPGQHFDVRLTAPDGYQAQRSYSVATAPEATETFDLTVELMPGGEVSPFFHDVVQPGDALEVRGPIGGPFTWAVHDGGPVLFIAGGSGIVPIMSMLRHRRSHLPSLLEGAERPGGGDEAAPDALLLYSSRSIEDVIYRAELDLMAANDSSVQLFHALTRKQPQGWPGYARRVDREMVLECMGRLGAPKLTFICGPTAFVEAAADAVVAAGAPSGSVHTERFGPSGT